MSTRKLRELEALQVPREEDQHTTKFIHETGLTHEQAASQTDDISVVEVVGFPHKHGKPFVTEEEEINRGTQMFNFHNCICKS